LDPVTVETTPVVLSGDPLVDNVRANPTVGVVVLDPSTRRRLRLNGDAEVLGSGALRIHARQLYGNCPQYIQERRETESAAAKKESSIEKEDFRVA
jgi:hypothetical protein